MKNVLITGANKGLGFETAKQMAELGYFIYMGCRDITLGQKALEKFYNNGLTNVLMVHLDVTKLETILTARDIIASQTDHLDILINNAGITGAFPQPAESCPVDKIKRVFETNFFGVIQVTQTFLPLLHKAIAGRIVNVSSGLGSLTSHSNASWQYYPNKSAGYSVSKTALNGFTVMLAYGLRDTSIKVNAVDPDYTATDLNQFRGVKAPVDSVKVIIKYATMANDCPSGKYFNEEGELPW